MSFGLNAMNADGAVIFDTDLQQMPLKASGSVTCSGWPLTGNMLGQAVLYGVTVSRPMLFVRVRSLNAWLSVGWTGTTQFNIKGTAGAVVDWRVYEAAGGAWDTDEAYGMIAYNSIGTRMYSTATAPPFIRGFDVALPDDSSWSFTDDIFIKNVIFSFTAYDGGLPYVSAFTISNALMVQGPGIQLLYNLAMKWSNVDTCGMYWKEYHLNGSNPTGAVVYPVGERPRYVLASK